MAKIEGSQLILSSISFWDASGRWIDDGEILVRDGRIAAVRRNGKIPGLINTEHHPATRKLDCRGQTLLPGFCDSHVHFLETGLLAMQADLSSAGNISEVLNILQEHSGNVDRWVRGCRLIPELLEERRAPRASELDSVFPKTPVFITRIDGHSSIINKAAGRMLSRNGFLVRNEDFTQPMSGDRHYELFHWLNARISVKEKKEAYRFAAQEAFSRGLTLVHGLIGNNRADCHDAEILVDLLPSLPLDVIPWFQTFKIESVLDLGLKQIGGCLMIDGSLSSRTAALTYDYLDDRGNRGILLHSDRFLEDFLEQALLSDLQVAFHAIGDRAIEQLFKLYGRMNISPERRWRIEHGVIPDKKHIEEASRLGVLFSVQPAFEAYAGGPEGLYSRRIGDLWRKTHPFRTLIDNGIILAGGSDSPVTPMDPLTGMHYAINHPNSDQRLKPFDALKMFTCNGAYAAFQEEERGEISTGKSADLVLLDRKIDPGNPDFISARVETIFFRGEVSAIRTEKKSPND